MADGPMLKRLDTSKWTRADVVREARMQTLAIQKLSVWLRIGYSLVAIGFLVGYWGFYGDGGTAAGVAGVIAIVVGAIMSVILKVGTSNGKKNVEAMLLSVGIDLEKMAAEDRARAEAEGRAKAARRVGKLQARLNKLDELGREFAGDVKSAEAKRAAKKRPHKKK